MRTNRLRALDQTSEGVQVIIGIQYLERYPNYLTRYQIKRKFLNLT